MLFIAADTFKTATAGCRFPRFQRNFPRSSVESDFTWQYKARLMRPPVQVVTVGVGSRAGWRRTICQSRTPQEDSALKVIV
jgi:hypothetical protein